MLLKETKKTRNKKVIVSTFVIVLLFIGVAVVYFLMTSRSQTTTTNNGSDVNLSEPSADELKEGQRIKQNTVDQDEKTSQPNETAPETQTVSVSLNSIQNGNQVIFDTVIQQVFTEGQCSLTITAGGQKIEKTASTFSGPSTSSCRGFSVATSELPAGTWRATLQVTSGNYSGSANSQVEVQ